MSRSLTLLLLTLLIAFACAAPITTRDTLEKRGGTKGTFKGTGTWFLPASEGGDMGACGKKEGNKSMIVAMNRPQYGNTSKKSKWCGKKLKIKGPKGSVTATVNDACPECKKGDLDLTPIVFKKVIGDMNKGVGKITWHAV
ncbi:RlpA-like double-psi beta-barrel-protein domain-containing protein-containing protein [Sporodiniella umbellata]|nr:RlpA-like double-psi beta-barrel-protein domain-containing protein-containing protein [Sporodiniella umbellata]